MRIAGIVIVGFASAALVGGSIIWGLNAGHSNAEGPGVAALVIGLPTIGGSLVLASVGVPLWVVGARAPKGAVSQPPPTAVLSLSGPTMLRLSF
jgi:hypothetical protein